MDPTVTVICAALLIWLGLARPSSRDDQRRPGAPPRLPELVSADGSRDGRANRNHDEGSVSLPKENS